MILITDITPKDKQSKGERTYNLIVNQIPFLTFKVNQHNFKLSKCLKEAAKALEDYEYEAFKHNQKLREKQIAQKYSDQIL